MSYIVDIAVLVVLFFVTDKFYGPSSGDKAVDAVLGVLLRASLFTVYVWYF